MASKKIQCSPLARTILEKISRSKTSSVQEADRAELALLLLDGQSNLKISKTSTHGWGKAKRWRERWLLYEKAFAEIEGRENKYHMEHDLEQKVRECLRDAPRSGSPGKFTAEQYCRILGVALEPPKDSGRPITEWTLNELVDEVQKRGIVESISRSQLGAFLKGSRRKTT